MVSSKFPCISLVLHIQLSYADLGLVDSVPRTHGGGIVAEGEIRPVTLIPRRSGHFNHLGQLLLRLVVGEDVFKVEILRRQVQGIEACVVQQLSLGIGESHIEADGSSVRHELDLGRETGGDRRYRRCGGCRH